ATGEDAEAAAIRVVFQDVRAVFLRRMRITIVIVRPRTNRDIHLLAIARKRDVARPVSAASHASAGGQIRYDGLRRAAGFHVAILIGKADDCSGIAYIYPLRLRPRGIERYAERTLQSRRKGLHLLRFAIGIHAAKNFDLARG